MIPLEPWAPRRVLVTGATGQDGRLLTGRLLAEGSTVHAVVRPGSPTTVLDELRGPGRLQVHEADLVDVGALAGLVATVMPDEIYNLAGLSSVSASFADPSMTWETNARPVIAMLEAVRTASAATVFYQASSSEMFGGLPGESVVHDETSPLLPQSPYAAAKAAAHLACGVYRSAFGLRVCCGVSFNHESSGRPASFLTRKVVDHVRGLRACGEASPTSGPLRMGNLAARRDWGFAPDYVEGILRIARQVEVRRQLGGPGDQGGLAAYRDYVLGTGRLHAVWELVDRAFAVAGFDLEWQMGSGDPAGWQATFRHSGLVAVAVDRALLRPADPIAIQADPARAREDLGWVARPGLDLFLAEMLQSSPDGRR